MIELLPVNAEFTPHVVCDVCRKPITEVGNLEWFTTDDGDWTPTQPVLMAHKACS